MEFFLVLVSNPDFKSIFSLVLKSIIYISLPFFINRSIWPANLSILSSDCLYIRYSGNIPLSTVFNNSFSVELVKQGKLSIL